MLWEKHPATLLTIRMVRNNDNTFLCILISTLLFWMFISTRYKVASYDSNRSFHSGGKLAWIHWLFLCSSLTFNKSLLFKRIKILSEIKSRSSTKRGGKWELGTSVRGKHSINCIIFSIVRNQCTGKKKLFLADYFLFVTRCVMKMKNHSYSCIL